MKAVRFAERLKPLLVPIDSVQQHPDNPNSGDIEKIVESIQVNGFNTVVTVDEATGYIIAGNHRYQALHALGATEIPIIHAVQTPDMRRYMLADNEIGKLAMMDKAMEMEILKDLKESDLGLAGTGLDEEEFDRRQIELANEQDMPLGEGFGEAPNSIFQIVIEFGDRETRDEVYQTLKSDFDGIRTVNL